mmetsp:Transcript_69430/g.201502  ORF Transcript_69430/g.201502 Transcript_69430/m.201502 type:complete len:120 (+) Transcript_69430:116-475(+)
MLQEKYQSRGFSVLAFPISDFHQELSSNQEIQGFLASNYPNANFPVFGLSSLKDNAVYEALRKQLPNAHVQHNFFKFLVDSNGKAIKMFHKKLDPMTLTEDIETLLEARDGPTHKLVTH